MVDVSEVLTKKWDIIKYFLLEIGLTSAYIGIILNEAVTDIRNLIYLALKKPESTQYKAILHDFFTHCGIAGDWPASGKPPRKLLFDFIFDRVADAPSGKDKRKADTIPNRNIKGEI